MSRLCVLSMFSLLMGCPPTVIEPDQTCERNGGCGGHICANTRCDLDNDEGDYVCLELPDECEEDPSCDCVNASGLPVYGEHDCTETDVGFFVMVDAICPD